MLLVHRTRVKDDDARAMRVRGAYFYSVAMVNVPTSEDETARELCNCSLPPAPIYVESDYKFPPNSCL